MKSMPGDPGGREHGLDVLRVAAFLVLIFYHTGMGFVSWSWVIKNNELSEVLQYPMLFVSRWRLPLLFFISGAGVAFSLRTRAAGEFAWERLVRLGMPVLFGILVIVPPQIYWERLAKGTLDPGYLSFWKAVFQFRPYPEGSTSWHHLWFVVYILVYSLLSLPLFPALRRMSSSLAPILERHGWAIYLVNFPNLIVGITLGPHFPTTHALIGDWANLCGAWLTFLWGFVFAADRRWLEILTRRRREFLAVALVSAAVFFSPYRGFVREVSSAYFGMGWIFAAVGYSRHWFQRAPDWLGYANEAVFPFYMVHQTITVGLVFALRSGPQALWLKFACVAIGTFLGSWMFHEIGKRTGPARILFGLKRHSSRWAVAKS